MPFSFNAIELCVVTINEKPWTRAREVHRELEYGKTTKTAHVIKAHVSLENYVQKYQMSSVPAAHTSTNWPKDSQKYDIYVNEEGMYEMLFSSQQPKAKDFRRHCCNVLFPHVQQQLSDKSHAMEIEDLTSRVQALEFTNEAHQQVIEEKDTATALLKDDLKNRAYENVGLQGEIKTKDQQIATLQRRYVGYPSDKDKNNSISIIAKNNEEAGYPYIFICRQHGYRRHKASVLLAHNQGSMLFADGDTPNAIVMYNFWQKHGLNIVDTDRPRHFRLDMINQEQLLALNDM